MDNADQIRAAATHLFASLGYEGTSLQAIADKVGVTKQTLLYHFPSKEALKRAVLDGVFSHFRARLPQMLEAVTSGRGRFDALTRELVEFFESDPDRARLIVREVLDNPDGMRRLMGDNLRPWILLVGQYIRQGKEAGIIHGDVDPEAYVLNVISSVLANIVVRPVWPSVIGGELSDARAHERQMQEMFRSSRTALFIHRGALPLAPLK